MSYIPLSLYLSVSRSLFPFPSAHLSLCRSAWLSTCLCVARALVPSFSVETIECQIKANQSQSRAEVHLIQGDEAGDSAGMVSSMGGMWRGANQLVKGVVPRGFHH